MQLSDYDVSAERGFLANFDPDQVVLDGALAPIRDAALSLPHLLPSGRIRTLLQRLPTPDIARFCADSSDAEQRLAMVHYSFLVQAWVWGEADAPRHLPENLAVPIWLLARKLGQQPLLPYSGYVLDNWGRLDRDAPIALDNIYMPQQFLGGQDEAWFVMIHVAIEATAGRLIAEIPALIDAAARMDGETMHACLDRISSVWDDINAIFDRMPERCDPYVYFHRVRPWIHGWKDNPALGPGRAFVARPARSHRSCR